MGQNYSTEPGNTKRQWPRGLSPQLTLFELQALPHKIVKGSSLTSKHPAVVAGGPHLIVRGLLIVTVTHHIQQVKP